MTKTTNEKLLDFQVAQSIRWIRLGNREAREAVRILTRVRDNISATLIAAGIDQASNFSRMRQEALKRQIDNIIDAIHLEISANVTEAAVESAVLSAQMEAAAITRALPVALDIVTPNIGVIQQAATLRPFNGQVLGDWIDDLREADKRRTWNRILDGIISGEPTDSIIRGVNGSVSLGYKDGVRNVSSRGVTALVRTSINHATNQGRQSVWEANQDVIGHVKWISTLDTRTTPICRHRDNRVGPVERTENYRPPAGSKALKPQMARPPAHPNCRSTTVAVTKSWRELGLDFDELDAGTRSSLDGRVPEDMNYFDWLRSTSKANQIEALGESRFKLWKEGGLNVDRFQNDEGVLYTLDQLRKRQPEAFEKSGL